MEFLHTEKYKGYTINVEHDQMAYADPPTSWGNFDITMRPELRLISTGEWSRYFDQNNRLTTAARAMLKSGRLWPIYYTEHGPQCAYKLDVNPGWERIDGFIEFAPEYVKGTSKDERREYARQDLEEYTAWANGDVYAVQILDPWDEQLEDDGYVGGIYGDYDDVSTAKAAIDGHIKFDRPARHGVRAQKLHN